MSIIATPVKKAAILKSAQRNDLIEFLYSLGHVEVGDQSSKPDSKEFRMYLTPSELKAKLDSEKESKKSSQISVYYPATRGFLYFERIVFNPEFVHDRRFGYFVYGWGLFHLQFEPLDDLERTICHISYCDRTNLKDCKRLLKEFESPRLWDWKRLEELQSKLSNFMDALEWQSSK